MMRLAIIEGSRRERNGSLRSCRQPLTMSYSPSSIIVEELGDIGGVVLAVSVHRDDVGAAREVESGGESGGLPEVPAEAHDAQVGFVVLQAAKRGEAIVGAAVVHGDDFVGAAQVAQHAGEFGDEGFQVAGLVVDGQDDGDG